MYWDVMKHFFKWLIGEVIIVLMEWCISTIHVEAELNNLLTVLFCSWKKEKFTKIIACIIMSYKMNGFWFLTAIIRGKADS